MSQARLRVKRHRLSVHRPLAPRVCCRSLDRVQVGDMQARQVPAPSQHVLSRSSLPGRPSWHGAAERGHAHLTEGLCRLVHTFT